MTKRDAKKLTALDKVKFWKNHELIEGVIVAKGTEVSFSDYLNLPSNLVFPVIHSDPKDFVSGVQTNVCHLDIYEKTGSLLEESAPNGCLLVYDDELMEKK